MFITITAFHVRWLFSMFFLFSHCLLLPSSCFPGLYAVAEVSWSFIISVCSCSWFSELDVNSYQLDLHVRCRECYSVLAISFLVSMASHFSILFESVYNTYFMSVELLCFLKKIYFHLVYLYYEPSCGRSVTSMESCIAISNQRTFSLLIRRKHPH